MIEGQRLEWTERFVPGAHVRVRRFPNEWDVGSHDVVSGSLFAQVSETLDLLPFKYLKAGVSIPVPRAALKEALLNAVVHRDYAIPAPIEVRVREDSLRIFNPGRLPEGWTAGRLRGPPPSLPRNPGIANAFFLAGEIEAWGRGIECVFRACRRAGAPEPKIEVEPGGVAFEFRFSDDHLKSVA